MLRSEIVYDAYQSVVGSFRYRKALVSQNIPTTLVHFLDIGCGTGSTLEKLPNDSLYTGIDISLSYLEKAKQRRPDIQLIQADVTNSQWTTEVSIEQEAMGIALGIYHHLSDSELESTLINLIKVLPSGSKILSMDPVILPTSTRVARWFAENDRGRFIRPPEVLKEILQSTGFEAEISVHSNRLRIPLDTIEVLAKVIQSSFCHQSCLLIPGEWPQL